MLTPLGDLQDFGEPYVSLTHLEKSSPIPGPLAEGTQGDWFLANERFRVCISGLSNPRGYARSGGNLLDIAPQGSKDVLRQVFTYFDDTFPRQAVYSSLEPQYPDSVTVSLLARGVDSENPHLQVLTTYRLKQESSRLEIETQLINTGTVPIHSFELGDVIEWGRGERFAPGQGGDLDGTHPQLEWLGGAGEGTAFLYLSEGSLTGPHGDTWSDPITKIVTLAPGDTVGYTRWILVAQGGISDVHRLAGIENLTPVGITVTGRGQARISGCRISVVDGGGNIIMVGTSGEAGECVMMLPQGRFTFLVHHPERGVVSRSREVKRSPLSFKTKLPEPGVLHLQSRSQGRPVSAKWVFKGVGKTPDPRFGPNYRLQGAGNTVFTPGGDGLVRLPQGTYQVTCTQGLRHDMWQREVSVWPGGEEDLQATLVPLPFSEDWVSADLHVHTLKSPGSNVDPMDRWLAMACEGVDWFAATDHFTQTVFSPVMESARGIKQVRVLSGQEITFQDRGHFNVFPLQPGGMAFADGVVRVEDLPLEDVFRGIREGNPGVLVQLNHPRSGRTGRYDIVAHDARTGEFAQAMEGDPQLLEVWSGKYTGSREQVWEDWMSLLKRGYGLVGVGNSDSHGLAEGAGGMPRSFVRVGDPASSHQLVEGLKSGRVQVTNGPLIEFVLEGASVGETLESDGNAFSGHLRVIAGSWVDVSLVEILVDGHMHSEYRIRENKRPIRFDEDILIRTIHGGRSFVQVRVTGTGFLAFTNPIWVEIPFAQN